MRGDPVHRVQRPEIGTPDTLRVVHAASRVRAALVPRDRQILRAVELELRVVVMALPLVGLAVEALEPLQRRECNARRARCLEVAIEP